MMDSKKYVLQKILNTEVQIYPWKHLIINNFIPTSLYEGIKQEVSVYNDKFSKAKSKRGYTTEINKSQNVFPNSNTNPYLHEYAQIISDPDIEKVIKQKVNIEGYHSNNLSKDMWSSFDIQSPGFIYDVHPDHESKIHTLVHYLADFGDDKNLGTTLYSPDKNTFGGVYWCDDCNQEKCICGKKLPPFNTTKDFLKRASYIPNNAIIFSPCTKIGSITNHSMFHLSEKTKYRKTLQTFWLKENENWTNLDWSALNLKK